jgi:hypothetical protein
MSRYLSNVPNGLNVNSRECNSLSNSFGELELIRVFACFLRGPIGIIGIYTSIIHLK